MIIHLRLHMCKAMGITKTFSLSHRLVLKQSANHKPPSYPSMSVLHTSWPFFHCPIWRRGEKKELLLRLLSNAMYLLVFKLLNLFSCYLHMIQIGVLLAFLHLLNPPVKKKERCDTEHLRAVGSYESPSESLAWFGQV